MMLLSIDHRSFFLGFHFSGSAGNRLGRGFQHIRSRHHIVIAVHLDAACRSPDHTAGPYPAAFSQDGMVHHGAFSTTVPGISTESVTVAPSSTVTL